MSAADIRADDLCLYAMGFLDRTSNAQVEALLAESTEARGELERIRGDLALLGSTAAPVAPGPDLRHRIEREIELDPKPMPPPLISPDGPEDDELVSGGILTLDDDPRPIHALSDSWAEDSYTPSHAPEALLPEEFRANALPAQPSGPSSALLWAGWALAASLAAACLIVGYRAHAWKVRLTAAEADLTRARREMQRETANAADAEAVWDIFHSGTARQVLLRGAVTASAHLSMLPEKGTLVMQAMGLAPVPDGKTYALWFLPTQTGETPVPTGLFQPDAKGFAMLAVPSLAQTAVPGTYGVTVEDAAGASGPTLPYVLSETP